MSFILALDQGTTSSRSILFDRDGLPVAMDRKGFRQMYPRHGWVEHDAAGCEALTYDGYTPLTRERTGLVLDAYFSATKLAYLLNHVEGARRQAEAGNLCFGTIDSWLIYRLTDGAVHATDVSNASRTMLLNIDTCTWDDELLDLFEIPRAVLPEVRSSSGAFGRTAPGVLDAEIPIKGAAGDQQAALFGQVCTRPGLAKNTYGTGCFLLMNTGEKRVASDNNLLTTLAWRLGDSSRRWPKPETPRSSLAGTAHLNDRKYGTNETGRTD